MNAREKHLLARHCLLNPGEVVRLWHRKDWEKLAAVVEYARRGTPDDMALTDPFMYRKLCAGLCEYKIRGFGGFDLAALQRLAAGPRNAPPPITRSPTQSTARD